MTKEEIVVKLLEILEEWAKKVETLRQQVKEKRRVSWGFWNNRQYRKAHELEKEARYYDGMKDRLFFCVQEVISCIQDETGISDDGLSWDADKISRALDNVRKLKELAKNDI